MKKKNYTPIQKVFITIGSVLFFILAIGIIGAIAGVGDKKDDGVKAAGQSDETAPAVTTTAALTFSTTTVEPAKSTSSKTEKTTTTTPKETTTERVTTTTEKTTTTAEETTTSRTTLAQTEATTIETAAENNGFLVLNSNTMKAHMPNCSSVDTIQEENKIISYDSIEEIKDRGYSPCGKCKPW